MPALLSVPPELCSIIGANMSTLQQVVDYSKASSLLGTSMAQKACLDHCIPKILDTIPGKPSTKEPSFGTQLYAMLHDHRAVVCGDFLSTSLNDHVGIPARLIPRPDPNCPPYCRATIHVATEKARDAYVNFLTGLGWKKALEHPSAVYVTDTSSNRSVCIATARSFNTLCVMSDVFDRASSDQYTFVGYRCIWIAYHILTQTQRCFLPCLTEPPKDEKSLKKLNFGRLEKNKGFSVPEAGNSTVMNPAFSRISNHNHGIDPSCPRTIRHMEDKHCIWITGGPARPRDIFGDPECLVWRLGGCCGKDWTWGTPLYTYSSTTILEGEGVKLSLLLDR
jgi:hypothetical protein